MKQAPDTPAELKARALRHLARREHSRAELARKLAPYAQSGQLLEDLLCQLESRKQLCDERFAEQRAHALSGKYGAVKIRHDLKAKGVEQPLIDRLCLDAELETAGAILKRKYRAPAATHEERAKRARFLQSRGFSNDVIRRLVLRDEEE